jgi:hypothetical protein
LSTLPALRLKGLHGDLRLRAEVAVHLRGARWLRCDEVTGPGWSVSGTQARDLHQRPASTFLRLVHAEEVMRIAGNVRTSWSLCGAGPARAEIDSHLPGQGYDVATFLIGNGDLVVGQHGGQVLQR